MVLGAISPSHLIDSDSYLWDALHWFMPNAPVMAPYSGPQGEHIVTPSKLIFLDPVAEVFCDEKQKLDCRTFGIPCFGCARLLMAVVFVPSPAQHLLNDSRRTNRELKTRSLGLHAILCVLLGMCKK
jgi:hypothetical protein